jgi:tetratricopeptide (TPR) repeat protein
MRDLRPFSRLFHLRRQALVSDYPWVTEPFANPIRRWAAIALTMAVAAWLIYVGLNHALASHYGGSSNPDNWSRAAKIEPANAENWYRLGRYRQLDFDHADLPLAISHYRRAVQLNPRSAYYKLDLASALEMSGNNAEADKYYRAAQENYPISAEVSWRYGNFLLRQQRLPEAYAEIRRAVVVDRKLIPLAVSRSWHSDPNVRVLLDEVLPNTPAGDWEALSFLVQAQEGAAALAVWNHLVAQKAPIDWHKLLAFTDMLVGQERFEEAGSVWRQATVNEGSSSNASGSDSLVYDGGFERDPSGGGFGWRQQDVAGAGFDFDSSVKHSGTRSARVAFDGTQNISYEYLYQMVLVAPGKRYHFRGFLRTDHISTDCGVRFEIRDPRRPKDLDVLTPNETGSEPWTLEEADFTTGPQTHLIQILLRRLPSARFDNKLNGTVWVDDVAVLPAGSSR